MSFRAPHVIYEESLLRLMHGFPLHDPNPLGNCSLDEGEGIPGIKIGDIGYLR